jgi:hypothetical protein
MQELGLDILRFHTLASSGSFKVVLEKGLTNEHPPSLVMRNSQSSIEPQQQAPTGTGMW